ncbi:class I SAM-dependent methyltransferase [Paenibacillus sp. FSL K6-2524]|uniref:class I SAM-dependent methyltransferase n=1 Tax=Paenibacillus sp. FSL K6-2524 TaxID=2954516 RepID=UPI0030F9D38F
MTESNHLSNNVTRFTGYANLYDKYRPEAPLQVVNLLTQYVGHKPTLVLDLGCGTGLSTIIWKEHADQVVGIEPNEDMRNKALEKLQLLGGTPSITFVAGYSDQTPAKSASADIVTCSQSFHWMEPESTLKEINRILKKNGVFAVYDCDWPPTLHWTLEAEYLNLIQKADAVIQQNVDTFDLVHKWNKDGHLDNFRASGIFRFTKEIVFHNIEICSAERYVGLALSQGSVQNVLKLNLRDLDEDIEAFGQNVERYFDSRDLDIMFNYRMRLGVK